MSSELDSAETIELLASIQAGQAGALEKLLSRDRDLIRRIAAIRLSTELAARIDPSDVAQEAQLEVSRRIADYLRRRPMPYRIWLRRTALETLARLRRQHLAACRNVGREAVFSPTSYNSRRAMAPVGCQNTINL